MIRRLLPVALLALPGCEAAPSAATSAEQDGAVPAAWDSAGLTIVENRTAQWNGAGAWRAPPGPRLSLGVLDGDAAYQFVDISAAARQADGDLIVADAGTRTVRLYGPAGVFRGVIGTAGSGPGEFLNPTQVLIAADDAITVWDDAARRITVFDPAGALAETRAVNLPGSAVAFTEADLRAWAPDPTAPALYPGPMRLLSNGDLLIRLVEKSLAKKAANAGRGTGPAEVLTRRRSGALRAAPDLSVIDTVMLFGDAEEVDVEAPWGPQTLVPPLARNTSIALQPDEPRVCIGDQAGPEVRCFEEDGSTVVVRWQADPVPVEADDPDVEAWRAGTLEAYGLKLSPEDVQRLIARVPIPATRPEYSRLVLDRDGNLWVRRGPARNGGSAADQYLVFDRAGALLGSTTLPAIRILEIGSDYILGVFEDSLEVQYLHVYDLVKPADDRGTP